MNCILYIMLFSALCLSCGQRVTRYETICEATAAGDIEDVRVHLRNGAAIEMRRDGYTPFLLATMRGDTLLMNLLADHGANLLTNDDRRRDALDLAVRFDRRAALFWLHHRGIIATGLGQLLLQFTAIDNDHYVCLDSILTWQQSESLPLDWSALANTVIVHDATQSLKILIQHGLDINFRFEDSTYLIHRTLPTWNQTSWNSGPLQTVIELGADVNVQDRDGMTPLAQACRRKWPPSAIEILMAAGADPTIRDHNGHRPIHWIKYEPECLAALLKDR